MGRFADHRQEEAVVHDRGGAGAAGATQARAAPLLAAAEALQTDLKIENIRER